MCFCEIVAKFRRNFVENGRHGCNFVKISPQNISRSCHFIQIWNSSWLVALHRSLLLSPLAATYKKSLQSRPSLAKLPRFVRTCFRIHLFLFWNKSDVVAKASQEVTESEVERPNYIDSSENPFEQLRDRFLAFKKHTCLENPIHYQSLSLGQAPKFMVIACADSRVCPSKVLGFQPGEAFTIRNVANLVPPFQHGASETSAALEFAVNSLEVGNILVVGHSCCGGIQALMSMSEKNDTRSFIKDWVFIAKTARLSTKAVAGHLNFEQQCRNCEKESIHGSLLNLLTYPWIEKRVVEGKLNVHGGYYDFVNCTFEKWTLVYREKLEGGSKYGMKDRTIWS